MCTFADVWKKAVAFRESRSYVRDLLDLRPDVVTSFSDTVGALAARKAREAHGEYTISADVLALAPPAFARLMHPLYIKCSARLQHPIGWKGGMLHDLHEQWTHHRCGCHRGILLADEDGKAYHKHVRTRMLPLWSRLVILNAEASLPDRQTLRGALSSSRGLALRRKRKAVRCSSSISFRRSIQ